jgi:hypothetical protein
METRNIPQIRQFDIALPGLFPYHPHVCALRLEAVFFRDVKEDGGELN